MKKLIAGNRKELGMLALLVALCLWTIGNTWQDGGSTFLTPRNLSNLGRLIGMYGIFSIGLGLVIITGGIELSVGSLMALLGVLFFFFLSGSQAIGAFALPDMNCWVALGAVLLIGALFGVFHGVIISKYKLQPFIVTLCGLLSYRGLAKLISHDPTVNYTRTDAVLLMKDRVTGSLAGCIGTFSGTLDDPGKADACERFSTASGGLVESIGLIPLEFVYLLVVASIMYVVLHKSVYGRYVYAVGRNELAAKYSGINTVLILGSVYVICSFLTSVSAVQFAFYTNSVSPSTHGNFYELYGIAAAVLGGCSLRGGEGSIFGILVGTAILIVLRNMVNLLGYDTSLSDVITGGVIFVGVLVDTLGGAGFKAMFGKWAQKKSPAS